MARSKAKPAKKPPKKHGGKRAGAGRKQSRLPDDMLKGLGVPPSDPLKKSAWWSRVIEVLQYGVLQGKDWTVMLRDARQSALAAAKMMPEEIKARAAQLLEDDDRETNEDVSPKPVKREDDPIARAGGTATRRDAA